MSTDPLDDLMRAMERTMRVTVSVPPRPRRWWLYRDYTWANKWPSLGSDEHSRDTVVIPWPIGRDGYHNALVIALPWCVHGEGGRTGLVRQIHATLRRMELNTQAMGDDARPALQAAALDEIAAACGLESA